MSWRKWQTQQVMNYYISYPENRKEVEENGAESPPSHPQTSEREQETTKPISQQDYETISPLPYCVNCRWLLYPFRTEKKFKVI